MISSLKLQYLTLLLLLPAALSSMPPIFLPVHNYVRQDTCFYDLGGRAGLITAEEFLPGVSYEDWGGIVEVYWPGEGTPFWTQNSLSVYLRDGGELPSGVIPGSPLYMRRIHPDFGCISTSTAVGEMYGFGSGPDYPSILIPLDFSAVDQLPLPKTLAEVSFENPRGGETLERAFSDYLTSDTLLIDIRDMRIAEHKTIPAVSVRDLTAYPYGYSPYTLSVEEVGGSSRTWVFHFTNTLYLSRILHFGKEEHYQSWYDTTIESTSGIEYIPLRSSWVWEDIPSQIILSLGVDGYSTDTVTLEPSGGKFYRWHPLLVPEQGVDVPYPAALYPELEVLSKGVADQILGECSPSASLAPAQDPNHDGVQDAVDLRRTRLE